MIRETNTSHLTEKATFITNLFSKPKLASPFVKVFWLLDVFCRERLNIFRKPWTSTWIACKQPSLSKCDNNIKLRVSSSVVHYHLEKILQWQFYFLHGIYQVLPRGTRMVNIHNCSQRTVYKTYTTTVLMQPRLQIQNWYNMVHVFLSALHMLGTCQ